MLVVRRDSADNDDLRARNASQSISAESVEGGGCLRYEK